MPTLPFKSSLIKLAGRLQRLNKSRQPIIWVIQILLFTICGVLAYLLRFDFDIPPRFLAQLYYSLPIWIIVKCVTFGVLNLDRGVWRFVSIDDALRIFWANLVASFLSGLLIYLVAPLGWYPRSIFFLDFMLTVLATMGTRIAVRILLDSLAADKRASTDKRVLIYGAGAAGVTLSRELRSNANLHYQVCGFVDDNPKKIGARVQGLRVLGSGSQLPVLVKKYRIGEVLIAAPSATSGQMAAIFHRGQEAQVKCRTIPAMSELIQGRRLAFQIRDVAVEDLLGRAPAQLDVDLIKADVTDKVILVTGAAGSIGSELCHQLAQFSPAAIVGLDCAETPLFFAERVMMERFPSIKFHAEIGNILNKDRIEEILEIYRPCIVYHAAAYKHVPMMETHVFEAVKTNVLGTYNLALAAARHGVEDFVMISTDKAVRPTSIMGVSKRLAELVILSLQNEGTKYVSVRFGNVLGSNGSVIPIFKQQIAAGGPVTVTHPEMRRYFMTIPEASQLVLQASTMGTGGEIFVLDMGAPVKIVDLARNLIMLSGLRPGEDIKIEFTGARPGEKLYEELNSMEEYTLPTHHEKIKIFGSNGLPPDGMTKRLGTLKEVCATRDLGRLILELKDIVPDYSASAHILRRVLQDQHSRAAATTVGGQTARV